MVSLDILMPHYNDVQGVALSLNSIKSQTWNGEVNVIIYDDGSEQQYIEKLESLLINYNLNIYLVKGETNKGRPYARNALIREITSQYVAWLDAGDEWYPNKIKEQFFALYRAKYIYGDQPLWITCNYDWQWVGKRKRIRKQVTEGDQLQHLLIGQDLRAYLWTLLAEAETFKNLGLFDEHLPRLQDLDYFVRFSSNGGKIVSTLNQAPLCVYHKSDIGRDGKQIRDCFKYIYIKHKWIYKKYSRKFNKNRLYEIELHAARFAQNNSDYTYMLKSIFRSLLMHPSKFAYGLIKNKGLKL